MTTKIETTNKPARAKTQNEINAILEVLAKEAVSFMIEYGNDVQNMKDSAKRLEHLFGDFLLRDIRHFAETGKYPEYA